VLYHTFHGDLVRHLQSFVLPFWSFNFVCSPKMITVFSHSLQLDCILSISQNCNFRQTASFVAGLEGNSRLK